MFSVNGSVPGAVVTAWTLLDDVNSIAGLVPSPGENTTQIKFLGNFPSRDACWRACNSSATASEPCFGFSWHTTLFDPAWATGCYKHIDSMWFATPEVGVQSGRAPHMESTTYTFGAGGNQGGEGSETGGEWWVEGMLEELDAPNEFHYDANDSLLRFKPNLTAGAPPLGRMDEVTIPTLATLIDMQGSQDDPIRNVTISHLTMTATRPTFMEPRGNPSGGDWALERSGALRLEGTVGVTIANNTFQRLDSNAVSINGYNRHCVVDGNEFVFLGQNAVASWGRTHGNDGTHGEYPRFTRISRNYVHEIGHIQKQSSFYFQAITAQATITHNIAFNMPRAAINFNDGFGGGAEVNSNLLFNTCRESGDHGAFNSWDRLPYITNIRNGTPSTVPAVNDVHHNMIVSNYNADGGCLDNDDGSAYYDIHDNVCYYGGHKQNFDGHSKRAFSNIYIHPSVYGVKCVDEEYQGLITHTEPSGLPPAGYAEQYFDNICILPNAGDIYVYSAGYLGNPDHFQGGLILHNNTIFAPFPGPNVSLGGSHTFADFQAHGYDPTSRASTQMPATEQIITWSKDKLGL